MSLCAGAVHSGGCGTREGQRAVQAAPAKGEARRDEGLVFWGVRRRPVMKQEGRRAWRAYVWCWVGGGRMRWRMAGIFDRQVDSLRECVPDHTHTVPPPMSAHCRAVDWGAWGPQQCRSPPSCRWPGGPGPKPTRNRSAEWWGCT